MVRENWKNLNGLWEYAIGNRAQKPSEFHGQILVPFAIESQLSGVQKRISADDILWYKRTFDVPSKWRKNRVMLNFGAVDWEAVVFVKGKKVGMHQGGYDPFSFDITDALNPSGNQQLDVRVWDPTSSGTQARGKQVINTKGIWQTVWIEPVAETFIQSMQIHPDIEASKVALNITAGYQGGKNYAVEVAVFEDEKKINTIIGKLEDKLELKIDNPKLWSPDSPFLYGLEISLLNNGKKIDHISSYFGMRKISKGKDSSGHDRLLLNNKILFQYGTLDQGWWPDGLYTAPTDEALKYDIEVTKKLGFNMIRKHVKVEPARWYYHCDRLGMLVWQDVPNGDKSADWRGPSGYDGREIKRTAQSAHQYYSEWKNIIDANYNKPSIVMWVPFNEGWGQFDTEKVIQWTMDYDTSRLVDGPSGGNYFPIGHVVDEHRYPGPGIPEEGEHAPIILKDRVLVLGEFGGLWLPTEGHMWLQDKNLGYQHPRNLTDSDQLLSVYKKLIDAFPPLIKKGVAAAIYTQTTDVEHEANGLMTYDRAVIKMDVGKIKTLKQAA